MISKQYKNIFWYALLAFSAAMLVNKLMLVFTYRFEIAGLEPYFTYLVLKVDSGQLFTNPEQYPFIVTQYSPLYFYVVNVFAKIIEWLGVHEVRAVYVAGRAINLACNIFTCYLIYQFAKQYLKIDKRLAGIIALVVFNLFINHNIGVRPDSLKILFLTGMFIQLYRISVHQEVSRFLHFSILAVLALLSKQDALVPVLLALFVLFCHRYYVKSIISGLAIGLVSGLIILALFGWDFNLVMQNLIGGIAQGMNPNWWMDIVKLNYLTFIVQVIFLGIGLFWMFEKGINKVWMLAFLLIYAAAFMALFKWGSNFNYFIEFQIVGSILAIYVAFVGQKQKLQLLVVVCILGVYFNNFQNKNVTLPNFWVERDAISYFSEMANRTDEIQDQVLKDYDAVICFSMKEALFLNQKSIQWAMVNDFPEVFLPKLEELSSELPIQVFDYQFDCNLEVLQNTVFMSPKESNDWYQKKLNKVFGRSESEGNKFQLDPIYSSLDYSFYKIVCP